MKRFIALSFLLMGWTYYELSGGGDFVPEVRPADRQQVADARISTSGEPAASAPDTPPVAPVEVALAEPQAAPVEPTAGEAAEALRAAVTEAMALDTLEPADDAAFVSLVAPAEATDTIPAQPASDGSDEIRIVDATRLNVRQGPSTSDGVVGQLVRGEIVSLVEVTADGWALVRIEGDGIEGWVASRFLIQ